jgi:16S rRNA C967 or C1407 C5-methylase (RsmB/RsmF family)
VFFDRVLCDVPCSSDAAIRKIPQKWENWCLNDGQSLHPLQLRILIRGLNLLNENGVLTYSTCSLNPVENEAVVAAALMNFKD